MAVAHKSAISVGLLYIPVGLYKTNRYAGILLTSCVRFLKKGFVTRNIVLPATKRLKMRISSRDMSMRRENR